MIVFGLCGRPNSGKGEVSLILERYGFRSVDKNGPLRAACSALTGIGAHQFATQAGKASLYKGVPLRKVMGEVGKTLEALYGNYHLVELALANELSTANDTTKLIVEPLRMDQTKTFPHPVIEVISNRGIDTGNDFDLYNKDNIAYRIYNDSTLSVLEEQVVSLLFHLGIR